MNEIPLTNGTVPIGAALLGRAVNAAGEPLDGAAPLSDLRRFPIDRPVGADEATLPGQMLETGIKVIDLYAPIARGGTIPMLAVPGVGLIVTSTEMIQSVVARRGGCVVIADLGDHVFSTNELVAELRSSGVDRHTAIIAGQRSDPPEVKRQVALMGLTLAEYFCDQGRETLLFLDANLLSQDTFERLRARRHGSTSAALTLLVWHIKRHIETPSTVNPDQVLGQPLLDLDGRLVFSRALAKQSIWPAIDPLASTSRLLDGLVIGAEHARVARAARELLRDYGDLEGTSAAGDDPRLRARARRVLLFQGQPFVVAEPFTATPGEYVGVEETVRGFGELVAGQHDDVPEEAFRFTGTLDQALGKAAAA